MEFFSGEVREPDEALLQMMSATGSQVGQYIARKHAEEAHRLSEERAQQLVVAKETAERANQTKSQFLANMSHELRTPMHAILSFASLCIQRYDRVPSEKLLSYLTQIKDSGNRLLTLVNNLLDLSKLDAGKMVLNVQSVDIKPLIVSLKAQIDALIVEKGLKFGVDHWTDDTHVQCDADRITQVLWNLVSNAVKFTPAGNRISLSFRSSSIRRGRRKSDGETVPALHVTVRDGGPGIPEDEMDSIFEKFVQSSKTKTGAGGTGLGLAICREIIVAHGGRIWAENHVEQGAMVHFVIPMRSVQSQGYPQEQTQGNLKVGASSMEGLGEGSDDHEVAEHSEGFTYGRR